MAASDGFPAHRLPPALGLRQQFCFPPLEHCTCHLKQTLASGAAEKKHIIVADAEHNLPVE